MEKNNKKKYYYQNNNNKRYYPKKKKQKEMNVQEEKMTYEKIINMDSDVPEIVDYPSGSNDNMMSFVAVSIIIMAIVFGSLLLFRVI